MDVVDKPGVILEPPHTRLLNIGETLQAVCHQTKDSKSDVKIFVWVQNGNTTKKFKAQIDSRASTTFSLLNITLAGEYMCAGENTAGRGEYSDLLSVSNICKLVNYNYTQ